ncbi:MAG TPA: Asd/ArgC dimerization domain-containing protein [Thermoanaerobaculia bacterium]|nr:Asd/ArgC dimerization domain-containing protein [Thermoanaerobaculia bacterium]
MTRVAVLGPTTLLGQEVRSLLDRRRHLWQGISLLAGAVEEEGAVTEVAGEAALVVRADAEALAGADLIFACGRLEHDLALVEQRSAGATAILLSPEATADHGEPIVAGIDPTRARRGEVLVSPHPSALALAYLLAPLAAAGSGLAAEGASATVVQPVSLLDRAGLDDLLDQTRSLVAMTGEIRPSVFERQLAFNLYPSPGGSAQLAGLVRRAAGLELPLAVEALQGAIFHGVSVSLFVRFAADPGVEAVRRALAGQPELSLSKASLAVGEAPGPVEAAARDDVLVGSVRPDPGHPGGYWLWAVMDNLTRGGALNAIEIAEAVAAA